MALTKVSTDGVKDDAITSGKIPANAVGASELADNAVDTNAIANNAVTAGKTSGVQTTITNNADNRVITGSGTANTLQAESNVLLSTSSTDNVFTTDSNSSRLRLFGGSPASVSNGGALSLHAVNHSAGNYTDLAAGAGGHIQFRTGTDERMRIDSSGKVGIGTTSPSTTLSVINDSNTEGLNVKHSNLTQGVGIGYDHVKSTGSSTNVPLHLRAKGSGGVRIGYDSTNKVRIDSDGLKFNSDTAAANALDDYEFGTFTPTFRENNTASNTSYNWRYGEYTKIGRLVHCRIAMGLSAFSGNFSNAFLGIPFTAFSSNGNSTFEYVPVLGYTYASGFGDSGSSENLFMEIYGHNVNSFRIVKGNGKNNVSQNDINSGQRIAISFIYTSGG